MKATQPIGGLMWGEDFAASLKKDIQAITRSRKEDWARRHDQCDWAKKRERRLKLSENRLERMIELQKKEWEAAHRPATTHTLKKTTSLFAKI